MKKSLTLLTLSFLVVSCYEEIILPTGDEEPVAVMNAQMNTRDKTHKIELSVSQKNRVRALAGADVRVTVNGKATITATEVADESAWSPYHEPWEQVYSFDADLKPGDEVRIEADKDAFHLSATVKAPPAAAPAIVDTATVRLSYMGDSYDYLQVKVGFRDIPGDTWYRVAACMESEYAYLDEDGNPVPDCSGSYVYWLEPETGFDAVISEGGGKTGGLDFGAMLSEENSYNCFSDNAFRDQECTIRPLFSPYSVYDFYDMYIFPEWDDYSDYEALYERLSGMAYRSHRTAHVQVRSIDFTQYHYLKALQNLDTYGTEMTFLVEPTTLPSNVEGGLGFVGLETVSDLVFYESEVTLPAMNDLLYY